MEGKIGEKRSRRRPKQLYRGNKGKSEVATHKEVKERALNREIWIELYRQELIFNAIINRNFNKDNVS